MTSRFLDWFWQLSAERTATKQSGDFSLRALELARRGTLASEAAGRIERPAEPFTHAGNEAVAAELYREAAHWALLSYAERQAASASTAGEDAQARAEQPGIAALLESAPHDVLVDAAGGAAELEQLRPRLAESYRDFAELEPGTQRKLVEQLGRFSRALLAPLAGVERTLERIWIRRVSHVLGVVCFFGLCIWGTVRVLRIQERQNDLAVRAAWTTSSLYPVGGCPSPKQKCEGGGDNYFFHTNQEKNPSITFDLGKDRKVSAVEVDNRLDCCFDRAKPLAVSVSQDGQKWQEVTRFTEEFTNARKGFSTVKARYVRLQVVSSLGILHLSRVRIYP